MTDGYGGLSDCYCTDLLGYDMNFTETLPSATKSLVGQIK